MNRLVVLAAAALGAASSGSASPGREDDLRLGLVGEYYSIGKEIPFMPVPKDIRPVVRRVDRQIDFGRWESALGDFGDTNLDDYFYVKWTGLLRVPTDGTYTLYLESDDGSKLYLDGTLVVDNDGVHPMRERNGRLELKSGNHDLKIEFFQNAGLSGCKASWETAGMEKQVIPAASFLHPFAKTLDPPAK